MTVTCATARYLVIALLIFPVAARAQQPLTELSLEDLMGIDAGQVFGASDRIQPVTEAPASVSFITAAEIARYGYRTLAEILQGVRGMYVTNDRNFSYLGTRGFGKPGDYNSRILLLVNGHRVNDNVFGQAEIGAEFGIDVAMFERVEIIRGPASSLYGDSAFFAVVNVITRTGASLNGGSLTLDGGSLGTRLARASLGHRLANGVDYALSGTYEGSNGVGRLYFPAFDAPATNSGIANGLDGERLGQFYGRLSFKALTLTAAYGRRERDVPTASFGTLFNAHDPHEETTDRHTLVDVEYAHALAGGRVTVQAAFDRFTYDGVYPQLQAADSDLAGSTVSHNGVVGARWSVRSQMTHPLPGRQVMTLGAEFIDNIDQDQELHVTNPSSALFAIGTSSKQHAVFVQDEAKLTRWLIVNAGLRYDAYDQFVRVTPRTALIVMPSASQSFKYLYGVAFRAPTAYELNSFYWGPGVQNLRPESIETHEIVWERYTNDWLRTSVSGYWYEADRLVTLVPDDSALLLATFVNEGQVRARGVEAEAQMRLIGALEGFASYSRQRAADRATGTELTNSPRQMVKARISAPGPINRSFVSAEVLYISDRTTIAGSILPAATLTNLTVRTPVGRAIELFGSVRNLFNVGYADPGADPALDVIPQNGRTFRIGLQWKVGSN